MKYPVPKKLEIIKSCVHELLSWLRFDSVKILKGCHCYCYSFVSITATGMKVNRLSARQDQCMARGHPVVL